MSEEQIPIAHRAERLLGGFARELTIFLVIVALVAWAVAPLAGVPEPFGVRSAVLLAAFVGVLSRGRR